MPNSTSYPYARFFQGLGAQADSFLYHTPNSAAGVNDDDVVLNERRTAGLKLPHARLFVDVGWFDPMASGSIGDLTNENVAHLIRRLHFHKANGTKCNLVLFAPYGPSPEEVPLLVRSMVAFVKHLIVEEGLENIAWLTLWNEPEIIFPYDSPLSRRVWGDDRIARRPGYETYRAANKFAHELIQEGGLGDRVRLVVCDAVWGARIRMQQMELALEAFHDLDVAYAYHNYNPEDHAFYVGNEDFAYAGMGKEAAEFRALLGPERPLFITEMNSSTGYGFNSHCLGFGPAGGEWVGTVPAAIDTAVKIMEAVKNGVDAISYWCLHDVIYLEAHEIMPMGLWRYKSQDWAPRPVFHYYALLMDVLRPGSQILGAPGLGDGLFGLDVHRPDGVSALRLNAGRNAATLLLPEHPHGECRIRRVNPEEIPPITDLPFSSESSLLASAHQQITLQPGELIACGFPPAPPVSK